MTPLFRPSRERRGADPYLPHKTILFAIGAGLGIAGMLSGRDWLINAGILVLLAGFLLRFLPDRRPEQD